MASQLAQLEEAEEQILRVMEHAGSVAELLADVDGQRREEVLAACHAFKSAMENVGRILEESIDGLPPESGAHAHRDTYVAAAKLDLAADKAAYLHKRLSTVVGGIAAAAELQPQTDVAEAELAAVAARAGFSFAVPLRSQPPPAAAASSSEDMHIAGGDDEPDGEGAGDGDESGSDIEDLDAVLAAEEAAAEASGSDIEDLDAVLAAEEAAAAEGRGSGSASGGGWQ